MTKDKLVFTFAMVFFSFVPALHAQQTDSSGNTPQTAPQSDASQPAPQPVEQISTAVEKSPSSTQPGHPLDPADIDVLTGKRDRVVEAGRMTALPVSVRMYGNYGDLYLIQGRSSRTFDIPMLPLARITNPFFFFPMQSRGFGRVGGFRGGR